MGEIQYIELPMKKAGLFSFFYIRDIENRIRIIMITELENIEYI